MHLKIQCCNSTSETWRLWPWISCSQTILKTSPVRLIYNYLYTLKEISCTCTGTMSVSSDHSTLSLYFKYTCSDILYHLAFSPVPKVQMMDERLGSLAEEFKDLVYPPDYNPEGKTAVKRKPGEINYQNLSMKKSQGAFPHFLLREHILT